MSLAQDLVNMFAAAGAPGMTPQAAAEWIASEGSVEPTNPLGILYSTDMGGTGSHTATGSNGHLAVFSSPQAGLAAAAYLVTHSVLFSGILQAVRGGNANAQANAIITSDWSGSSHYQNGAGWAWSAGGQQGPTAGNATAEKLGSGPAGPLLVKKNPDGTCPAGYVETYPGFFGQGPIPYMFSSPTCILQQSTPANPSGGTNPVAQAAGQIITLNAPGLSPAIVDGALLVLILLLGYQGVRMVVGD